jgi:acyl carrier protein
MAQATFEQDTQGTTHMALSHDEIYQKVQGVLVDSLGVEDEDVRPTASLRQDLGAESIDFLDISFRLEKTFGIKIPRGELFPENLDPSFVQDNKLTDAGLAEVRRRLPHADLGELERTRDTALIPDLFAVQDIVDYIGRKTAAA